MKYGYGRCSTNETRQHIDRQIRELLKMGVPRNNIYTEYESGVKKDRVELQRLLDMVVAGDIIYTTEASRITRSMKQLLEILDLAKERKIKLVLGTFSVDFSTSSPDPITLATIQLMGVFAELERNIISDRVKSGMENAKSKGKQIGRKEVTIADIPNEWLKYYEKLYKQGTINKKTLCQLTKTSYPTTLKYIKMLQND